MKIIYSQLQKLLPKLDKTPQEIAYDLTMIGHFSEGIEKKQGEVIINLEVRQNRGDCLGYWGIAKELAVLYDLSFQSPSFTLANKNSLPLLPLKIVADKEVKRLMAVKLNKIKNGPAPIWLKKFLNLHDINSINCLVDFTNYIMIWYGLPNHAFDAQKSGDNLVWQINRGKFKKFTSFDGHEIELPPGILQINNQEKVLSLAGIVGGKNSGVQLKTKTSIIEMALYNPTQIRKDSQKLNIKTEASHRLEKQLDTNLVPLAFAHLITLIQEHCQAKIATQIYDYFPQPRQTQPISFHAEKSSQYAGINISEKFARKILKNLGCQIKEKKDSWQITSPSLRSDLNLEEDLIEEVIRFFGYQKIPTDQPISNKILPDITPPILYLIESAKNALIDLSYDEILSWPLIKKTNLIRAPYLSSKTQAINTQNNINDRYPILRQSLISSLIKQKKRYQKLKIRTRGFFEIGKIFYQKEGRYLENYSLAIYQQNREKLKKDVQIFLCDLQVEQAKIEPIKKDDGYFVEFNLEALLKEIDFIPKIVCRQKPSQKGTIVELKKQIISFDANILLDKKEKPLNLIEKYQQKIPADLLWKLEIVDVFKNGKQYKYTFRAYYYNCSIQKAKKTHQIAFNLH